MNLHKTSKSPDSDATLTFGDFEITDTIRGNRRQVICKSNNDDYGKKYWIIKSIVER